MIPGMKKSAVMLGLWAFATVGAAVGCKKDDPAKGEKLDRLEAKLDAIGKKLDAIAARPAAAPQRPMPAERRGADPATVYSVPIDNAAVKGPATAKVTIVEAAEFACPFCRMAQGTMEQIAKAYPNDVRFVFKHFVVHPQTATIPALATCAAQQQGKFWEMEKAIWDSAWEAQPRPRMKDAALLGKDNMLKLAKDLGLNMDKFTADLDGAGCKEQIAKHQQQLGAVGVDGTPAFYVNGRPISGAQPFDNFKAIIDEELKKADQAIKSGIKPEEYYQKVVVEKGKKSV
jgi:protein-disulfide isomerase